MSLLSAEQLSLFEEKGYLVVENLFTKAEVDALRIAANDIVRRELEKPQQFGTFTTNEQNRTTDEYFLGSGDKVRVFLEEKGGKRSVNKIGHALHDLNKEFKANAESSKVKSIVKSLGFKNPAAAQSMFIFKDPFVGGEVNPHQDSTFLYTNPLSTIGLWIAIDDAKEENACLWAVPGSHKAGIRQRFIRAPDVTEFATIFEPVSCEPFDITNAVPLIASSGSLIVIHGSLVHFR